MQYADAGARALLADRLDILADPAAAGWSLIKQNASRSVYAGQLDRQAMYIKHFHPHSRFKRLARRVGLGDARREMRRARQLRAAGVDTPDVLACCTAGGCEWVLTRAVAPATPADVWHGEQLVRGQVGRAEIRRMIDQLAGLIGRMHAAGIVHRDLHCGNVLVQPAGPAWRLVLMDLHRTQRRARLSRRLRAANLAQLMHDRWGATTRSERMRFLVRYLAASGAEGSRRGWAYLVEQFARRHRARQLAQRDRRPFRRNKYFSPIHLADRWGGHVVLASKRCMAGSKAAGHTFTAEQWRQALAEPESLLSGEGVVVVKDSPSSQVVHRTLSVGGVDLDVFIKRSRRKRAWKGLIDCLRRSRALRAFALGHALLARRIATALPLAALERRVGPYLTDSLLITETVEAPSLQEFLRTRLGGASSDAPGGRFQLAQEVLWQLGRLVQMLHDHAFAHRDLKATNLLVCSGRGGAQAEVVLLDLDGLSRRRLMTSRRMFQGLMRLNVSLLQCPEVNRAGRLRMLLGYLRRPGSGRVNFKPYWRVLEEWSDRKLDAQIRSRQRRQRAARRPGS